MKQKEIAASPPLLTGKKSLRHVRHEIGDRHLAGQKERDRAGEQTERQQDAAGEFEDGCRRRQAGQSVRLGADREIEQFLRAMLDELQGRDDAQDAECLRLKSGETVKKLHLKLHFPTLRPGHRLSPGAWTIHFPWPAINNR